MRHPHGLATRRPRVWDRFNGGIESVWYYRELVRAFREAGGGPMVDELDVVVTEIERFAGMQTRGGPKYS